MVSEFLAGVVVAVHLAFIAFVAVGGLLAWRWPGLLWLHAPAVGWAVAIVTIGFTCPLTPLEQHLRRRAGGRAYEGGFVDHYLRDVIYPGELTGLARGLVAALIIVGYGGLVWRRRRRHGGGSPAVADPPAAPARRTWALSARRSPPRPLA